jgi:hypothetical protein
VAIFKERTGGNGIAGNAAAPFSAEEYNDADTLAFVLAGTLCSPLASHSKLAESTTRLLHAPSLESPSRPRSKSESHSFLATQETYYLTTYRVCTAALYRQAAIAFDLLGMFLCFSLGL